VTASYFRNRLQSNYSKARKTRVRAVPAEGLAGEQGSCIDTCKETHHHGRTTMQDKDDFIHLHATDQTIALDFSWKLRRRDLDFHETEIDYQDADCRCRIRIDRLDLAMPATRRFMLQREWLVVVVEGISLHTT